MHTNIYRRGIMFALSSPSGAGKTTISRMLMAKDDNLSLSISVTTRQKREGEEDGRDYFFVNKDKFADMLMNDELLEHAKVFENYYGTPRSFVENSLESSRDVIFDIDWQGTRKLAKIARHDLVSVFILPPSLEELGRRLHTRARDSREQVEYRMSKARDEISHWDEYDYVVINEDAEKTTDTVYAILRAERLRRERQRGLDAFVAGL